MGNVRGLGGCSPDHGKTDKHPSKSPLIKGDLMPNN